MKRALLIATGTVGGLGAVMMITPPQLGDSNALLAGASATTSDPASNNQSSAQQSQSSNQGSNQNSNQNSQSSAKGSASTSGSTSKSSTTAKKSTTTSKNVTKSGTTSNSNTTSNSSANNSSSSSSSNNNSNPEPVQAAPAGVTGNFTGDSVNVGYGNVQVRITVSNGKITDATALQAPGGRSQRFTDYSVPNLRSQTLQVQSAAINGVSGASYTSYGWYKSLISALQKAGMPTGV